MNIFFPNVGRRCELVSEFKNTLPSISPGLVWGSDPNPLAPGLRVVDSIVEFSSAPTSQDYFSELLLFLDREKIDLIVLTIDPDLVRFSQWRSQIEDVRPGSLCLLCDEEVLEICNDKRLTKKEFTAAGLRVPNYRNPDGQDDMPVFIKPAKGSGSEGASRVDKYQDFLIGSQSLEDPMIEEVVGGLEYSVDALFDLGGRLIDLTIRKRIKIRAGEVAQGEIVLNGPIQKAVEAIACHLRFVGFITFQFRWEDNCEPVAMEINARPGGGLPASFLSGKQWVKWLLGLISGQKQEKTFSGDGFRGTLFTRCDQTFLLPPVRSVVKVPNEYRFPQCVIFDLDDTLYREFDFVSSGYRAVSQYLLDFAGVDISPKLYELFREGRRGDLFTTALAQLGRSDLFWLVEDRLVDIYRDHEPDIKPAVGAVALLNSIKESGRKLALVTDGISKVQQSKIDALGISNTFDFIVKTGDLGPGRQKPSRYPFEQVLSMFNLDGREAVYIADNQLKDFIAPNALGMKTIQVCRPDGLYFQCFAHEQSGRPQFVIESVAELIERV